MNISVAANYFDVNPKNGAMTVPTYSTILLDQIATSVLNAQIQSIDGLYTLFDSEGTPENLVEEANKKRQQEREDVAKMSYLMAAEMLKARASYWESQGVQEQPFQEPQFPELNPEGVETIKKAHEIREL